MEKVLLEVKDLSSYYRTRFNETVRSVDHVSLRLREGGSLGVAGESGCGKSTLAMSLMGYYYPPLHFQGGQVLLDGTDIAPMKPDRLRARVWGGEIAYIPQAAMNALNPTQKILSLILDVMKEHRPEMSKKDVCEMARERFETLNLSPEILHKHAVELSGGMKQRTVVAISTILNPKVLIADEPTSALDVTSQKLVIRMLRELMDKGYIKSMIFITHELPLLYNVTDDIMVMYAGQIVEYGAARDMIFDALHPYSKGLMNSIIVPEKGTREKKLVSIPGAPPNLKHVPAGCRFADRCKYASDACRANEIKLRTVGDRAYRCILEGGAGAGEKTEARVANE